MPDINECQICGTPAPPLAGQCDGVAGYRLIHDPWAAAPSFLDGNLHFSCLEASAKSTRFFEEFTRMVQAGHEEVPSLDASPPPLTRMGLGMVPIFSGAECSVFQSGASDRWMVVKRTGPWFRLQHEDLLRMRRSEIPRSPAEVITYRLPMDVGDELAQYSLPELITALGVEDKYAPADELASVDYEFVDYYAPKRILEYVARAVLPIPDEAYSFLAEYAGTYTPIRFDEEQA
ncbi:hypothetical protein [Streptomyces sp. Tu 3180]|uniref:hypothetical protein n=1 Tax=Streptomyces sp. Tu 3180 TaxID=2682611 RepID=UPI001357021D|nr:hypothetical protein [Streptomyces sp. Tu 3180]KAF3466850.1 hypothetical protein GL259_22755 [Streptomyces sp. Tu 3180]